MSRTGFEPFCRGLATNFTGPSAPARQPVSGRVGGSQVASWRFRARFAALLSLRCKRNPLTPAQFAFRTQLPLPEA